MVMVDLKDHRRIAQSAKNLPTALKIAHRTTANAPIVTNQSSKSVTSRTVLFAVLVRIAQMVAHQETANALIVRQMKVKHEVKQKGP